jgi:hypothetical protein
LKRFENLWVSVAFAEAGEHEASIEFLVQESCDEGKQEIFQVA